MIFKTVHMVLDVQKSEHIGTYKVRTSVQQYIDRYEYLQAFHLYISRNLEIRMLGIRLKLVNPKDVRGT